MQNIDIMAKEQTIKSSILYEHETGGVMREMFQMTTSVVVNCYLKKDNECILNSIRSFHFIKDIVLVDKLFHFFTLNTKTYS